MEQNYGICHLSVVPVRIAPSDKKEQTTQLLFGDIFYILEFLDNGKWIKIQIEYDRYIGWIDSKQYKSISEELFFQYSHSTYVFCNDYQGRLTTVNNKNLSLPLYCTLPNFNNGRLNIGEIEYTYIGKYSSALPFDKRELLCSAFEFLHTPYQWGGKSQYGIDCSGFVQQVFKLYGVKLPRDASQQVQIGKVINWNDREPTDLVFFQNQDQKVIHVGIVAELEKIIHASGEVRIDILDEKGIFNKEKGIYTHTYHSIRRLIN